MTNSEKLRNMAIDDLLKSVKNRADEFDVCIMSLLPSGRFVCPWHNDCNKCLEEWLNEEAELTDMNTKNSVIICRLDEIGEAKQ